MIKINSKIIKQDRFGDETLKLDCKSIELSETENTITWLYDSDSELFTVQCLVDHVRNLFPTTRLYLELPYIPNARQDRYVSDRIFTLKTFCKMINSMNFDSVSVLDPHSDVSTALLDRVRKFTNVSDIWYEVCKTEDDYSVMFPDTGAAKKYSECLKYKYNDVIVGNKHRNKEGRIDGYTLTNFTPGTKKVIILDDICSFGGTFVAAAKALRSRGVEEIELIVSHCEPSIFKGEIFNYIDRVYTTDTLLDFEHCDYEGFDTSLQGRIIFVKRYRQ